MSDLIAYRVGDRVRVVKAGANGATTFGDYANGDTGTVYYVDSDGWVEVQWDQRRFTDNFQELNRCRLLTPHEIEPAEAAPNLLAELEMMCNVLEGCGIELPVEVEARVAFARAAIAKATGAQA